MDLSDSNLGSTYWEEVFRHFPQLDYFVPKCSDKYVAEDILELDCAPFSSSAMASSSSEQELVVRKSFYCDIDSLVVNHV